MQIRNSLGQTIEAEWIMGPTMMDGRVVVKVLPGDAADVAAFFDGAISYEDESGMDMTVDGVLIAMTRKHAQDGWLVSLAKA